MVSPLLFPVKLDRDKIAVLDETRLPFEEVYIEVDNFEKVLWVLESMKTRAFGQVLLFFYTCVLFTDTLSIDKIVEMFKERRPTFDFPFLGEILKKRENSNLTIGEVVDNFISNFDKMRRARVRALAELLPDPAHILTICNVNGELIYLYEELKNLGKETFFYVSETRPYLQGTRLTFWELTRNGIPAALICDNQASTLMKEKKVNCVVTGADRATGGGIVNKIGTYPLARLTKHFNIPFYSLTQYPRDLDIASIEIEERKKEEVFVFWEGGTPEVDTIYPSFDITPSEYITRYIELKHKSKKTAT